MAVATVLIVLTVSLLIARVPQRPRAAHGA